MLSRWQSDDISCDQFAGDVSESPPGNSFPCTPLQTDVLILVVLEVSVSLCVISVIIATAFVV